MKKQNQGILPEALVKWLENGDGFTGENASCLCISVLKYEMRESDGIADEMFVLGGYPKWKESQIY